MVCSLPERSISDFSSDKRETIMKAFINKTCALCAIPLKWWNVQTCIYCKKAMCCQHSSVLRRPHSSVLFVVCTCCSNQQTQLPTILSASQKKYIRPPQTVLQV